jgi:transcription initiation factor TFIIIB Brf1 subunit/transcription initiation factor TFIIB
MLFDERPKKGKEEWARRKGYKSFYEYQKEFVERKGFKSYSQYLRYTGLKRLLKECYAEILDKDVLNAVLNECKSFIVNRKELRGVNKRAMLAAMTYKILREKEKPITLNEVSSLFDVDRWDVGKYFRIFYEGEKVPQPNPRFCIERYANNLNLPEKIKESAMQLYEENKDILRRVRVASAAATCLYLAGKSYGLTKREVAKQAKTTPATIRNVMKMLKENKPQIL